MANLITADIHQLNNLRVLQALKEQFSASPDQVQAWITRWITDGFTAIEHMIADYGGFFVVGDRPSLADCVLAPQVYSAERFGVDLEPFSNVRRVTAAARALSPVAAAHPSNQPDADSP